MTIQEVSLKFGYSQSSLKTQFKRTAAAIQKKYNVVLLRYYDEQGKLYYEVEICTKDGTVWLNTQEVKYVLKEETVRLK